MVVQRAAITPQNIPELKRLTNFSARGHVAWLPEQNRMIVIGKNTRFFDTHALKEIPQQWNLDKSILAVGSSHFGKQFAVVYWNEYDIYLYDLITKHELAILQHHNSPNQIKRLVFSPQGNWLVSEGLKHSVLWHIPSREVIAELPGWHKYTFSLDEQKLVSAGYGEVWQIDLQTTQREVRLHYDIFRVMNLVFSPDNVTVAACGDAYAPGLFFDATYNNPDAIISPELTRAYEEWSAAGPTTIMEYHQVLSQFNSAPVRLWNLEESTEIKLDSTLGNAAWTVAFSPDGALIAAGAGDSWSAHNPLQIWNSQTQETLALKRDANQHTAANPPRQLSFSPDGTLLVCDGGLAAQIELWGVRHKKTPGS